MSVVPFRPRTTVGASNDVVRMREAILSADAIVVGAGAGLSISAGFTTAGERFHNYFRDFEMKHGFHEMYEGAFFPYRTLEEIWAYWSRLTFLNRYEDAYDPAYESLLQLLEGKEYFVVTTNIDHCLEKAGFPEKRIFNMQGDLGRWQCSGPCHKGTYENRDTIFEMMESQGFEIGSDSRLHLPANGHIRSMIPSRLVPHCNQCGRPMTINIRTGDSFVEDELWEDGHKRYHRFLDKYLETKILFLEIGVGYQTPSMIKYPFWQMTKDYENAHYISINYGEANCPDVIRHRAICKNGDAGDLLRMIQGQKKRIML